MDKILNKVRALLAQAEDPAATPAEAEAFSRKAEELIAKYAVDAALLEAREHAGVPVMRSFGYAEPYGKAKAYLLTAIGEAYGCKVVRSTTGRSHDMQVVGYTSDLALVDMLFTSLLLQGTHALLHQTQSSRSFRTSFWYAFAHRVGERLAQTRRKTVEETAATTPGTALVLADRSAEVARAAEELYPDVQTSSAPRVSSREGLAAGREAADKATLNEPAVDATRARELAGTY